MARREENLNQIIRLDGNNCFMEALRNAFKIGKIQLNFFQYDKNRPQGSKFTNEINLYLDFKDFDVIYYEIMHSGATIKLINQLSQNPSLKEYEKQVVLHRGGSEDKSTGELKARQLKIFRGRAKPIVLRAEIGKGQKNKMGGFTMVGSPEKYVDIGMTYQDLEKLLTEIHRALAAFEVEKTIQPNIDRKFEEMQFEITKLKEMVSLLLNHVSLNISNEQAMRQVQEINDKKLPEPVPSYKQNKDNNGNNGYSNQNNYAPQNNNQYNTQNYYNQQNPNPNDYPQQNPNYYQRW